MENSSYFLGGAGVVVIAMLVALSWDSPKLDLRPELRPSRNTTPRRPEIDHDGFTLTRQKCRKGLCVACFVSEDERRLLGETWTFCPPEGECEILDTTAKKKAHGIKFGSCERNEVPPVGDD